MTSATAASERLGVDAPPPTDTPAPIEAIAAEPTFNNYNKRLRAGSAEGGLDAVDSDSDCSRGGGGGGGGVGGGGDADDAEILRVRMLRPVSDDDEDEIEEDEEEGGDNVVPGSDVGVPVAAKIVSANSSVGVIEPDDIADDDDDDDVIARPSRGGGVGVAPPPRDPFEPESSGDDDDDDNDGISTVADAGADADDLRGESGSERLNGGCSLRETLAFSSAAADLASFIDLLSVPCGERPTGPATTSAPLLFTETALLSFSTAGRAAGLDECALWGGALSGYGLSQLFPVAGGGSSVFRPRGVASLSDAIERSVGDVRVGCLSGPVEEARACDDDATLETDGEDDGVGADERHAAGSSSHHSGHGAAAAVERDRFGGGSRELSEYGLSALVPTGARDDDTSRAVAADFAAALEQAAGGARAVDADGVVVTIGIRRALQAASIRATALLRSVTPAVALSARAIATVGGSAPCVRSAQGGAGVGAGLDRLAALQSMARADARAVPVSAPHPALPARRSTRATTASAAPARRALYLRKLGLDAKEWGGRSSAREIR